MSAYVVSDLTINRFLAGLREGQFKIDMDSNATLTEDELKRLGGKMREMNVKAVDERYGPDPEGMIPEDPYRYRRMEDVDMMQAYKSLQCFLYQCMEGDIDRCRLYKCLEYVSGQMASFLLNETKDYQNAQWA